MALAIPRMFGADALAFGLSYLFAVLIHFGALATRGQGAMLTAVVIVAEQLLESR